MNINSMQNFKQNFTGLKVHIKPNRFTGHEVDKFLRAVNNEMPQIIKMPEVAKYDINIKTRYCNEIMPDRGDAGHELVIIAKNLKKSVLDIFRKSGKDIIRLHVGLFDEELPTEVETGGIAAAIKRAVDDLLSKN